MRQLTTSECRQVTGGYDLVISGYAGAGAIMAVVGFGSLFTPIGPITGGIAIGAVSGLSIAQFSADLDKDGGS